MSSLVKKTKSADASSLLVTGKDALGSLRKSALRSQTLQEALFLVIDHSASMAYGDACGESRISAVRRAASELLDAASPEISRVGVVKFCHEAKIVCVLANQYSLVREALDAIRPSGSTCVCDALSIASSVLETQEVRIKRMIVLSDGEAQDADQAISWARSMKDTGRLPLIDTVYFNSSDQGKDLMVMLAEISGGKFCYAANAKQLITTFKQLEVKTRGLLTSGGI